MRIIIKSPVSQKPETVWAAMDEQMLRSLSPWFLHLKVLKYEGNKPGNKFSFETGIWPITAVWSGLVTSAGQTPGTFWFEDRGEKLPFPLKRWKHRHIVRKTTAGSVVIDAIECSTNMTFLDLIVKPLLTCLFSVRKQKYSRYLSKLSI